jgi:hypothetical protein
MGQLGEILQVLSLGAASRQGAQHVTARIAGSMLISANRTMQSDLGGSCCCAGRGSACKLWLCGKCGDRGALPARCAANQGARNGFSSRTPQPAKSSGLRPKSVWSCSRACGATH